LLTREAARRGASLAFRNATCAHAAYAGALIDAHDTPRLDSSMMKSLVTRLLFVLAAVLFAAALVSHRPKSPRRVVTAPAQHAVPQRPKQPSRPVQADRCSPPQYR